MEAEAFDICDTKNVYLPCPNCGGALGMGLTTRQGRLLVEHIDCGFRGPAGKNDKAAFDAWNAVPRN